MEFIKENWFYLFSIVFIIRSISSIISRSKGIKTTFEDINYKVVLFMILEIVWMVIGIYRYDKLFFIALCAVTYIVPALIGFLSLNSNDFDDIKNNAKASGNLADSLTNGLLTNKAENIANEKNTNRINTFLDIVGLFIIIITLINHYKIALFYLFYN